jgi:predicted nuclease with TOPRIM domain
MNSHFNSLRDDFNPSPVSEFTQFSDNASNSSFIGSNSRYNQFYRRYEDTLQKSELKIHELEDKESELENTYIALIDTLDDMRENRLEEMSFNEKLLRLESQQMNDLAEKKELSSLNSQSMKEIVLKNMEQKLKDLNDVYNDQKDRTDNALTQLNGLKTLHSKLSNIHNTLDSINPNDALNLLNEKLAELKNQKKAYEDRISYLEDQIENAKTQKINALHSPSMLSLADEIRDSSFCAMAPPLSHRNAQNIVDSTNNPDESVDKSTQFLQENSIFKQHFNYSPGLLLRQRSNSSSFHSARKFLSSIDIQSDSPTSDLMKKYKELEKQLEISEKNEAHSKPNYINVLPLFIKYLISDKYY